MHGAHSKRTDGSLPVVHQQRPVVAAAASTAGKQASNRQGAAYSQPKARWQVLQAVTSCSGCMCTQYANQHSKGCARLCSAVLAQAHPLVADSFQAVHMTRHCTVPLLCYHSSAHLGTCPLFCTRSVLGLVAAVGLLLLVAVLGLQEQQQQTGAATGTAASTGGQSISISGPHNIPKK